MSPRQLFRLVPLLGLAFAACTPDSGVGSKLFAESGKGDEDNGGGGDSGDEHDCLDEGHEDEPFHLGTHGVGKKCCAHRGYVLTQHQFDTTTVTTLSSAGSAATQYAASAPATPVRGAIVRYGDQQVFGLEFSSQSYVQQSLDALIQDRLVEKARLAQLTFPDAGPNAGGTGTPGTPKISTIQRLPQASKILGVSVQAYLLNDASTGKVWRLSYATDLPAPSDHLRTKLAALQRPLVLVGSHAGQKDDDTPIAEQLAGATLLRSEVQNENGWSTVLDTLSILPAKSIPCSTYGAPLGWSVMAAPATTSAGSPGQAGERIPRVDGTKVIPANVTNGPGPWISSPQVYLFFWGHTFAAPAHAPAVGQIQDTVKEMLVNQYYTYPLDQRVGEMKCAQAAR